MGKRLIIKGADFSDVAVSVEDILNPLAIVMIGDGGGWPDFFAPYTINDYLFLVNNGVLQKGKASGDFEPVEMPSGYDSLDFYGAILVKKEGSTKYEVAYPDNYEKVNWSPTKKAYVYNSSQSTEPQETSSSGFKCAHISLNVGDVLVYNGLGGSGPRAVWVMKNDYSDTIVVADDSSGTNYGPICYKATENCEVFLNTTWDTSEDSFILRI